jgi:hypothetical protein
MLDASGDQGRRAGVGRRFAMWRLTVIGIVAVALLVPGAASRAQTATADYLAGSGTARVDGVLSDGEWAGAAKVEFQVNRLDSEGGGSTPATLYVMNDATNLYLGFRTDRSCVAPAGGGRQRTSCSASTPGSIGAGDSVAVEAEVRFCGRGECVDLSMPVPPQIVVTPLVDLSVAQWALPRRVHVGQRPTTASG